MAEWIEDLHPRGRGGLFVHKAGGGAGAKGTGGWALDDDDREEIAKYKEYDLTNRLPTNIDVLKLQPLETDAIKNYAGTGQSVNLNRELRKGISLDDMNARHSLTTLYLDDIMKKAKLPEDTLLYRYYGFATGSSFASQFKDMKPGDSFVDKGFMSTSYTPSNEDNVIKILAPKGSRGIVVPMNMDFENEVIIDRNSRLTYMGEDDDGTRVFKLGQEGVKERAPTERAEPSTEQPKPEQAEALRNYLRTLDQFYKSNYPNVGEENPASFMLKNGRAFAFDDSSYKGRRGKVHQCYSNAAHAALANTDLTYVEGHASVHGVPLEHAWCVDPKGKVIDPTLKDGKGILGYWGIPFKTSYLSKRLVAQKTYGLLDFGKLEQVMKDIKANPDNVIAKDLVQAPVDEQRRTIFGAMDRAAAEGEEPGPRGVHIRPARPKSEGMTTRAAMRNRAKWRQEFDQVIDRVVAREGFDRSKISYADREGEWRENTYQTLYGTYNRTTDHITMYEPSLISLSPRQRIGMLCHEIQHAKFAAVMKQYDTGQYKRELDKYLSENNMDVMRSTGVVVSLYAAQFWQRDFGKQIGAAISPVRLRAINETLAEVAKLREEGKRSSVPKIWNMFYDTVDRLYRAQKPSDTWKAKQRSQ